MTPLWVTLLTFTAFACAGYLATRAGEWATHSWPRYRELPVLGSPSPLLVVALALATGWIGSSYAARGVAPYPLALILLVCLTLDFACSCDIRVGKLPLAVTLPVLGAIFLSDVLERDWPAVISGLVVAAPFAGAALASKNASFNWSDVQLVMLGALVLNVTLGLLAFALACFLAVGVAFLRGTLKRPVIFAPYLALSIEIALLTPSAIQ